MKARRMIRQRLTNQGVSTRRLKDVAAKHHIDIMTPSDPIALKWPKTKRRLTLAGKRTSKV